MDCGDPTSNLTFLQRKYLSGSGPDSTKFESSMIIICVKGYIFVDYSAENVQSCTPTGAWSVIPNCVRMLLVLYITFEFHIKYN